MFAVKADVVKLSAVASGLPPDAAAYHRSVFPLAPGVPLRVAVAPEQIDVGVKVGSEGIGFTVTITLPDIVAVHVGVVVFVANTVYVPAVLLLVQLRAVPVDPFLAVPTLVVTEFTVRCS